MGSVTDISVYGLTSETLIEVQLGRETETDRQVGRDRETETDKEIQRMKCTGGIRVKQVDGWT